MSNASTYERNKTFQVEYYEKYSKAFLSILHVDEVVSVIVGCVVGKINISEKVIIEFEDW